MQKYREMHAKYSPFKLVGLFAGSLIGACLGASMALGYIQDNRHDVSFIQFVGYATVVFCGGAAILYLTRLVGGSTSVVVVSPEGFFDQRIASSAIPWRAIRQIGIATISRQKFIVLDVDPNVEAQLNLTRVVKWSREANRRLGVDGLCVTATGLTIGHDRLLDAIRQNWSAATGHLREDARQEKDGGAFAGRIEPTL